jgi:hypothetical protein
MHTAAVGAFAVLVGSHATAPDLWPHDVDRGSFLAKAATLTNDVALAATAIHGLAAKTKAGSRPPKPPAPGKPSLLHGAVVIRTEDVVGDLVDVDERIAALTDVFEQFVDLVNATPPVTTPPPDGIALHSHLSYGSALSNVQVVRTSYDQPGAR